MLEAPTIGALKIILIRNPQGNIGALIIYNKDIGALIMILIRNPQNSTGNS